MWETKVGKILDSQYNNDDELKQTWGVSRRVDESAGKKYARELQRTVYWKKDGETKNFAITLTMADLNFIWGNKDAIKSELAPSPKATPAPAAAQTVWESDSIEETTF